MRFRWHPWLATCSNWSMMAVLLTATSVSCTLEDPQGLTAEEVFDLRFDSTTLFADSISRAQVVVRAQGDTRRDFEVSLKAEGARFVGADPGKPGELLLKASTGEARATIVVGVISGAYGFSATVAGLRRDTVLRLLPARPLRIVLTANQLTAKGDGTQALAVSAALLRPDSVGSVSHGTRVDFVVSDTFEVEFPELRSSIVYNGVGSSLVARYARVGPAVIQVRAQVGEGVTAIRSNAVRLVFSP